jgi:hypothetical protein
MSNSRLSAAGAANMRFNAQTHGLTSKLTVIRGEDPAAYDRLRQNLFDEYQPATPTEATLVDQLAKSDWRLQRAHQIEILTFNFEIDGLFPEAKTYPAAAPAMALQIGGKNLDQVRRYMTTIERSYFRTLKELQHARQLRLKSTVSQNSKALESLFWNDPPTVSQNPATTRNATAEATAAAQQPPSATDPSATVSQNAQATEPALADNRPTVSQNPATASNSTTETVPAAQQPTSAPDPSATVSQNAQATEPALADHPPTVS